MIGRLRVPPKWKIRIINLYNILALNLKEVVSDGTRDLNFYTVVQHCVDNIPVIYTAEVDCSIDKEQGLENYIELKTHTKLADDKISTINKLNKNCYRHLSKPSLLIVNIPL